MRGYLSTSAGAWRVIVQGLPICVDKATREQAVSAACFMSVLLGLAEWNGDAGRWQTSDGTPIPDGKVTWETGALT